MFLEGQRLKAEFGADAVADLSIGQPLEALPAVHEAFARAAAEDFPGRYGYMPNSGYADVRERCAQDVNFAGVTAQSITVTAGAAGALSLALRAFVESGDAIVAVAPYFAEFRLYAETLRSPFVAVSAQPDGSHDLAGLAAALQPNTGAVILNSPCNPSGHVLTDVELAHVAEVLDAHNRIHNRRVLLVIDEVYQRLTYPPAVRAEPLAHYDRTVLARSFSKDLGVAGERIGYLVVHPSMTSPTTERGIEMCARALGFVNAAATAQRAIAQLSTWDIDIAPYVERRDAAVAAVRAAGIEASEPDGGLYLWARSPWPDTLAYVAALAERNLLVTPGVAFGVDSHFRVCFSQPLTALALARKVMLAVATLPRPDGGA